MSPPRIPRAPAPGLDCSERLRRGSEQVRELATYAEQASARMITLSESQDSPRAIGVGQGALDVLCSRLTSTANDLENSPARTRLEWLGMELARGLRRFVKENGEGYRVQPLGIYVDADPLPDGTRRTVRDVLTEIAKLEGWEP